MPKMLPQELINLIQYRYSPEMPIEPTAFAVFGGLKNMVVTAGLKNMVVTAVADQCSYQLAYLCCYNKL